MKAFNETEFGEYFWPVLEDQERFARTQPRDFNRFDRWFGAMLVLITLCWIGFLGLVGWAALRFAWHFVGKFVR